MCPAGYPEKHTPCLHLRHKQDQPVPLLSRVSRSPSKLGLLAPALEARPQCGAKTSTYPRLQSVSSERAAAHDKRVISLPTLISKYVLGIINMWLDQGPCNERSLINTDRKQCNPVMPRGHRTQLATPTNTPTTSLPSHHFLSIISSRM
jgi:hypothetical protein